MAISSIDSLVSVGGNAAMQAAANYLSACEAKAVDTDALVQAIRREVKSALPAALSDAREAFDAGMSAAAVQTFIASMKLAGIAASRSVSSKAPTSPIFVGSIIPA